MTIVAECPHCESRYHLRPDLLGKVMRCPNPDCREPFVVRDINAAAPAPTAPSPPTAPPPREIEWTPDRPLPLSPKAAEAARPTLAVAVEEDEPQPEAEEAPLRRKRGRPRLLLGVLTLAIVGLLAVSGVYVVRTAEEGEARRAKRAQEEFAAGQYPAARKAFEALAADYPESTDADRYRFFADLAGTAAEVRSVTARENPAAAVASFRAFAEKHRDSPLAKPLTGYGRDILDAGRKLAEDVAGHAEDRVARFRADRTKGDELARADAAVADGRAVVDSLAPFRDGQDPPLDPLRAALDRAASGVRDERDRLSVLAEVRGRLASLSDAEVRAVEARLADAGLATDPEARQVIDAARARLRGLVVWVDSPATPEAAPPAGGSSLLFVSPVGPAESALTRPASAGSPGVFLACARGILYALDEATGNPLWAERVGPDASEPAARVPADDGSPEVVFVASDVAGRPGLTARDLRTGRPLWHQPLPAPAVGPAVVVGRGAAARAFVAVRDAAGTVLGFDVPGGARLGSVSVGQPVSTPLARRPGTGLLYVAAESQRLFVLDADARDDDGNRLPPRCVRVIATGHPPGSLRCPPLVVGPPGTDPRPRLLVLAQADGPRTMTLRAFPLDDDATPPAPGTAPPEVAPPPVAEAPVPGWAWFPPAADGDRLALVTDAGQFRLFGVNQPGNADRPLFPILPPAPTKEADLDPIPGLVLPADDASFWVLAGGSLRRVRLSLDPTRGQVLEPAGEPLPLGVPTQPAHVNLARDTAYFVVRSPKGAGCRAVAVDLADGRVRWARRLGLVPPAAPVAHAGGLVLADEDGGLTLVPGAALAADGVRVADPKWTFSPPPADDAGPTALAPTADGGVVWAVTPHGPDAAAKLTVRRVASGRVTSTATVPAPGRLAGPPVAFGDALLLPASDGTIYRLDPAASRLAAGPAWKGDRVGPDAVCFLAALPGNEFLATDGGRGVARWSWPAGGIYWRSVGEPLTTRERIAGPPLPLPGAGGAPPRVLIGDETGGVWLYDTGRWDVVRRWRAGGVNPLPAGRPTSPFAAVTPPDGRPRVGYVAGGRSLVILDPAGGDAPRVVTPTTDDPTRPFAGGPRAFGGNWLTTDLGGRCVVRDGVTGAPLVEAPAAVVGPFPTAAGVPLDRASILVPLSDGSAGVVRPPGVAPPPRAAP